MRLLLIPLLMILAHGLIACSKKTKDGTPGYAKLEMANSTALTLSNQECSSIPGDSSGTIPTGCWTPSVYGMKMIRVDISADKEGSLNSPAGNIWANAACPVRTSKFEMGTGDDQKTIEYDVVDDCTDDMISTYFEFARASADVNADLNSQDHKIPPGTYNYVQMSFCIGGAKTKNLQFQTDGMTEPYQLATNSCGTVSEPLAAPVVIGEGESATVSLAYDLTEIIYQSGGYKDPTYCYVSSDEATVRCNSGFRSLKPSFQKR